MRAAMHSIQSEKPYVVHVVLIQSVGSYGEKDVVWRQATDMFKHDVLQSTPALTVWCSLKAQPETGAR